MGSYARFEHYLTTLEVETCPEFWPPSPVSGPLWVGSALSQRSLDTGLTGRGGEATLHSGELAPSRVPLALRPFGHLASRSFRCGHDRRSGHEDTQLGKKLVGQTTEKHSQKKIKT